jgi:hypothetical protein
MRYLFLLTATVCTAGCSLHDQIEGTASSWQGHHLPQVEAAWGAPSYATDAAGWTSWRLGNPQGGWIVGFHTSGDDQKIDDHSVTTWGRLPSDLPHELAPPPQAF